MSFSAGLYRELARQVGVKLALIDYDSIHEVGFGAQVCVRCWFFLNGLFRGGSYILAPLVYMAHGHSRRQFRMFVENVLCQAGTSDHMSVFDPL
jgi:hypothetical protein